MNEPFVVLGLAGGIGAGKSHVARAFGRLGLVVYDSDAEARAALERPAVLEQLQARWGSGVIGPGGAIDRAAVAAIVFSSPTERKWLESVVHPLLRADRAHTRGQARAAGRAGLVIDAPLLFEAGVDGECDAVVWVETPLRERLRRVESRGWDAAELARREAAQWPLEEKRRRCAYTVMNADGQPDVDQQVALVLKQARDLVCKRSSR